MECTQQNDTLILCGKEGLLPHRAIRFRIFTTFRGARGYTFHETFYISDVDEKVRKPLMEKGALFVLLYHFAGYTRVVGPTASGFLKMPFKKWALFDYSGAALWIAGYMGIGYGLGAAGFTLDSSEDYFRYVEWALLALVGFSMWGLYRSAEKAWEHKSAASKEDKTPVTKQPESIL